MINNSHFLTNNGTRKGSPSANIWLPESKSNNSRYLLYIDLQPICSSMALMCLLLIYRLFLQLDSILLNACGRIFTHSKLYWGSCKTSSNSCNILKLLLFKSYQYFFYNDPTFFKQNYATLRKSDLYWKSIETRKEKGCMIC